LKRILVSLFVALIILACKAGDGMVTPGPGDSTIGTGDGASDVPEPISTDTSVPDGLACNLSDLTASANWQVIPAEIRATITLANHKSYSCTIQGRPDILLMDREGIPFEIERILPPDAELGTAITLQPSAANTAEVSFTWVNWCRDVPEDGIYVLLTIPDYDGWVEAQFQDPNGQPLIDAPDCIDYTEVSVVEVGVLESVE
jgi:hypothetical protein